MTFWFCHAPCANRPAAAAKLRCKLKAARKPGALSCDLIPSAVVTGAHRVKDLVESPSNGYLGSKRRDATQHGFAEGDSPCHLEDLASGQERQAGCKPNDLLDFLIAVVPFNPLRCDSPHSGQVSRHVRSCTWRSSSFYLFG